MRLLISVLFTCLCFCPSFARPSQQDGQVAEPTASALTNKDVLEMLGAGLTAEVVIAKVKLSKCDFDTSPNGLKALKTANVPDSVILAMVQVPVNSEAAFHRPGSAKTVSITCMNAKEIPAYPTPEVSTAVANARCGSRVSVLDRQGTWVRIQTEDGKIGWVSQFFVPTESPRVNTARAASVSATPSPPSNLPANVLRAVAWRAIPWATTSYWQQPGSADTSCTGEWKLVG